MMKSSGCAPLEKGFSLIEVMIAMLILGVGVLGMAALQLNAMKFSHTASVRSQAIFLAYDISDRMRINRTKARAGGYDIALTASAPTGSAIVSTDLQQWKAALSSQLPAGQGAIARAGTVMRITIQWDEGRAGGSATQQLIFETRL